MRLLQTYRRTARRSKGQFERYEDNEAVEKHRPLVSTAAIGLAQVSDSGWSFQNPLAKGNPLAAVAMVDANTLVTVGASGTILRTTDGGSTWAIQSSGTGASLSGVAFKDATTGTVVGQWATILRTRDGGRT